MGINDSSEIDAYLYQDKTRHNFPIYSPVKKPLANLCEKKKDLVENPSDKTLVLDLYAILYFLFENKNSFISFFYKNIHIMQNI